MAQRSIIIIGAGIAGMAAGCYAQMNGYNTEIYEAHDKPGGLCTAWKRKGYTVDGCIHHLAGASPGVELYRLWEELGAVQGREMVFRDTLTQVESADGQVLTVYTDIDRLEHHMKQLSPADAKVIEEYTNGARQFTRIDLFSLMTMTPLQTALKAWPVAGAFMKWSRVTLDQFAERFQDPFLRRAFPTVQYDFADIPMFLHLNFLAGCHNKTLGWPKGGALSFARSIADRYERLGGRIRYRSRVNRILVEGDRAVGVIADGTEHRADVVISAADGHSTIFDMLGGEFADERIRRYYDAAPRHIEMALQVSFGVNRDMSQEPQALTWFLPEPVAIVDRELDRVDIEVYNFDDTLAPEGKTVVKVMLSAGYDYWRGLLEADRAKYDDEKRRVAAVVLKLLERRFPGISAQVEMTDVATPVTTERFTGNWRGLQAWVVPGEPFAMFKGLTRTLPGLRNMYMVGQWAEATIGLPTAVVSGRRAVQTICRLDGKQFRATAD